jgi:hypothetical protein
MPVCPLCQDPIFCHNKRHSCAMATIFTLSNLLILPFWFLMIVLPRWSWTQRLMNSPWVVAPPAILYSLLLLPQLSTAVPALASPTLDNIATLLSHPAAATTAWVHFLTFDLFAGRWAYLDGRERDFSPWLMAPLLFLILMVGPFGLLLYLIVRAIITRRPS